jgi:hypothetical protein
LFIFIILNSLKGSIYGFPFILHIRMMMFTFSVKEILRFIAKQNNIYWVLEHTPHSCPKKEFVIEGIQWLKKEIFKIE